MPKSLNKSKIMKIRNQVEDRIIGLTKEAFNLQNQIRDFANNEENFDIVKIANLCQESNVIWNQVEVLKEFGGKYRKEKI